MRVITIDDGDADRYRDLCAQSADALVYHGWDYRDLLLQLLGCRACYLAVADVSGRLLAALPLMAKDGPYGVVYNSLPFFGSHGGVIGSSAAAREMLLDAYAEITSAATVAAATAIPHPRHPGSLRYPHDYIDERIGQFTDLEGAQDSQVLLGRITASARYDLRLSQRAGVTVAVENDALDALKSMHLERMREIGGKPKPDRFFSLLPQYFRAGEQFNLYAARRDGALIALMLILYGGSVAEYFIPAVLPEHRGSQATAAILFKAMQDAAQRGMRLWNWGGTWLSQDGVSRFKRNWGAIDRPYYYYTRISNPRLLAASGDELQSGYEHFYVLPFSLLQGNAASAVGH
jgi:hypothetical protein